jgi:tetratricopeptide (TPR) repeat protein/SAM-dependent methyltransferase
MSVIGQALEHHRAGRLQQAEALYRQILGRDPAHPDALHLLGVIAHQLGQHERALEFIKQAIDANPSVPVFYNSLGEVLSALNRLDAAIAAYRRACAVDPDYVPAYDNLGLTLQAAGRSDDAIAAFRQAVVRGPDEAQAHYNLGHALHEAGKRTEAIVAYRQALALAPNDPEIHNNLGIALKDDGRLSDAIAAFRRALALVPDHTQALCNLGIALIEGGQSQEAIGLLEKVVTILPDLAEAHYRLGIAWRARDRLNEALAAFERAQALQPQRAQIYYYRAAVLDALGRAEEAIGAYRDTLRLQPEFAAAQRGLVSALRTAPPLRYQADLEYEISRCFAMPEINVQALARASAQQIMGKYRLPERLHVSDLDSVLFELASDELLITLLTRTVNVDAALEHSLTTVRRALLLRYSDAIDIADKRRELMAAIALQCVSNEYVFAVGADEQELVDSVRAACEQMTQERPVPSQALEHRLLLLAMYQPLYTLLGARTLAAIPLAAWSVSLQAVIKRALTEPLEEQTLEQEIEPLTQVEDPMSLAVRAQYEEHPYPRWLELPQVVPMGLGSFLRSSFPHFEPPVFLDETIRMLVAGCGTGFEPLLLARSYSQVDILAIDLSRRSLAYAVRKARELGIGNVRFRHADILNLSSLPERFEVIECVGVLHHLAEPVRGWRVLTELLEPGGVMRVALYSGCARELVIRAREEIRQRALTPTARDIKAFRAPVLAGACDTTLAELAQSEDFYSLSSCRDLLFHTIEHRFTLAQIREALAELDLSFIGFDLPMPAVRQRYRELFPGDLAMTDLAAWERFETLFPRTFVGMYTFWCQKPPYA